MNNSVDNDDVSYAMSQLAIPNSISQSFSEIDYFNEQKLSWYSLPILVSRNISTHSSMLKQSSIDYTELFPISYSQYQNPIFKESHNNSGQPGSNLIKYYDAIETQLDELSNITNDDSVEEEAVKSAKKVLNHIRSYQLPPPLISWHGGDAVVMVWSLGDKTYAITITNGEVGYVIRKNKKAIRIVDSISIDKYLVGKDLRLL